MRIDFDAPIVESIHYGQVTIRLYATVDGQRYWSQSAVDPMHWATYPAEILESLHHEIFQSAYRKSVEQSHRIKFHRG